MGRLGLIAGNGRLPFLFAEAAKAQGHEVHAVGIEGETDPALGGAVASLAVLKLGQLDGAARALLARQVEAVVLAGGVGRVRSLRHARPDLGMLKVAARLVSKRDDELLRGIASYLESRGLKVVAPTDYVKAVLAKVGHLAGPELSAAQRQDLALGAEVAAALGRADVGQTVVVRDGVVLAVEAVEGTDECIRRAGRYGGPGGVVVKRCKPSQDLRFDLPAAGPVTLEVMREAGARVLAVEASKTILLDAALLFGDAARLGLTVVGY